MLILTRTDGLRRMKDDVYLTDLGRIDRTLNWIADLCPRLVTPAVPLAGPGSGRRNRTVERSAEGPLAADPDHRH